MTTSFQDYTSRLIDSLGKAPWPAIESLAQAMEELTDRNLLLRAARTLRGG